MGLTKPNPDTEENKIDFHLQADAKNIQNFFDNKFKGATVSNSFYMDKIQTPEWIHVTFVTENTGFVKLMENRNSKVADQ